MLRLVGPSTVVRFLVISAHLGGDMSTWNDVRKHTGDGYPRRPLTPESFKEDTWVCHSLSNRWFKLQVMDGELVGGFDIHDEETIVPWKECYHSWDPRLDKKGRSR